jgi:hypothetical protein
MNIEIEKLAKRNAYDYDKMINGFRKEEKLNKSKEKKVSLFITIESEISKDK